MPKYDEIDAEPFKQQQFGTSGVEGVNKPTFPELLGFRLSHQKGFMNKKASEYVVTVFTGWTA